jgi:hypothetical protein
MDDEAAALRYALTVVIYLTAVTIYAVSTMFAEDRTSRCVIVADIFAVDTNAGGVGTGVV